MRPCKWFAEGKCKFGSTCAFSHASVSPSVPVLRHPLIVKKAVDSAPNEPAPQSASSACRNVHRAPPTDQESLARLKKSLQTAPGSTICYHIGKMALCAQDTGLTDKPTTIQYFEEAAAQPGNQLSLKDILGHLRRNHGEYYWGLALITYLIADWEELTSVYNRLADNEKAVVQAYQKQLGNAYTRTEQATVATPAGGFPSRAPETPFKSFQIVKKTGMRVILGTEPSPLSIINHNQQQTPSTLAPTSGVKIQVGSACTRLAAHTPPPKPQSHLSCPPPKPQSHLKAQAPPPLKSRTSTAEMTASTTTFVGPQVTATKPDIRTTNTTQAREMLAPLSAYCKSCKQREAKSHGQCDECQIKEWTIDVPPTPLKVPSDVPPPKPVQPPTPVPTPVVPPTPAVPTATELRPPASQFLSTLLPNPTRPINERQPHTINGKPQTRDAKSHQSASQFLQTVILDTARPTNEQHQTEDAHTSSIPTIDDTTVLPEPGATNQQLESNIRAQPSTKDKPPPFQRKRKRSQGKHAGSMPRSSDPMHNASSEVGSSISSDGGDSRHKALRKKRRAHICRPVQIKGDKLQEGTIHTWKPPKDPQTFRVEPETALKILNLLQAEGQPINEDSDSDPMASSYFKSQQARAISKAKKKSIPKPSKSQRTTSANQPSNKKSKANSQHTDKAGPSPTARKTPSSIWEALGPPLDPPPQYPGDTRQSQKSEENAWPYKKTGQDGTKENPKNTITKNLNSKEEENMLDSKEENQNNSKTNSSQVRKSEHGMLAPQENPKATSPTTGTLPRTEEDTTNPDVPFSNPESSGRGNQSRKGTVQNDLLEVENVTTMECSEEQQEGNERKRHNILTTDSDDLPKQVGGEKESMEHKQNTEDGDGGNNEALQYYRGNGGTLKARRENNEVSEGHREYDEVLDNDAENHEALKNTREKVQAPNNEGKNDQALENNGQRDKASANTGENNDVLEGNGEHNALENYRENDDALERDEESRENGGEYDEEKYNEGENDEILENDAEDDAVDAGENDEALGDDREPLKEQDLENYGEKYETLEGSGEKSVRVEAAHSTSRMDCASPINLDSTEEPLLQPEQMELTSDSDAGENNGPVLLTHDLSYTAPDETRKAVQIQIASYSNQQHLHYAVPSMFEHNMQVFTASYKQHKVQRRISTPTKNQVHVSVILCLGGNREIDEHQPLQDSLQFLVVRRQNGTQHWITTEYIESEHGAWDESSSGEHLARQLLTDHFKVGGNDESSFRLHDCACDLFCTYSFQHADQDHTVKHLVYLPRIWSCGQYLIISKLPNYNGPESMIQRTSLAELLSEHQSEEWSGMEDDDMHCVFELRNSVKHFNRLIQLVFSKRILEYFHSQDNADVSVGKCNKEGKGNIGDDGCGSSAQAKNESESSAEDQPNQVWHRKTMPTKLLNAFQYFSVTQEGGEYTNNQRNTLCDVLDLAEFTQICTTLGMSADIVRCKLQRKQKENAGTTFDYMSSLPYQTVSYTQQTHVVCVISLEKASDVYFVWDAVRVKLALLCPSQHFHIYLVHSEGIVPFPLEIPDSHNMLLPHDKNLNTEIFSSITHRSSTAPLHTINFLRACNHRVVVLLFNQQTPDFFSPTPPRLPTGFKQPGMKTVECPTCPVFHVHCLDTYHPPTAKLMFPFNNSKVFHFHDKGSAVSKGWLLWTKSDSYWYGSFWVLRLLCMLGLGNGFIAGLKTVLESKTEDDIEPEDSFQLCDVLPWDIRSASMDMPNFTSVDFVSSKS